MATDTAAPTFQFQGFQYPTTTPVPDEVFDVLAPQLSEAELRVLLYIIRRTFGFKKQKDPISLTQLVEGIKTKDGHVLDLGTGMSRRGVMKGCQGLVKKGVISVEKRLSAQGDYAVNIYSLRFQNEQEVGNVVPYGREPSSLPVGNQVALQQTVRQETEKQETAVVVATTTELEIFGIAANAAAKLTNQYPTAYIREKLVMAKELVAAGSDLVSQNPAGWLRRAIEEDYQPASIPPQQRKRSVRKKTEKSTMHTAPRATSEIAAEKAKLPDTTDRARQQEKPHAREWNSDVEAFPKEAPQQAQNIPTEQREPEKMDNATPEERRENELTWERVLAHVQSNLPQEDVTARLTGATLAKVTETAAMIFVPNRYAIPWLERRLYGQIAKAMKTIIGKDVDLQFIAAS